MSEEIKTEITQPATPAVETKVVEIEQSKIDTLINDAYKRGAKNGNKELNEALGELRQSNEQLQSQMKQQQDDLQFEKIVNEYDVDKPKYFKLELQEAQQQEDFNMNEWIDGLKQKEAHLFKGGNKPQPLRVDSANNNPQAPDFNSKVKGAKTMAEIYALQKEI
jgi:hypothetical protein